MAEEIGTLVARVVADTEQFRSEMLKLSRQVETNTARTNRALSSIGKATNALSSSFRMVTRVAAAFGVALSARALVNFTMQTINAAAELHNLSKRLNISVESLSELQYVAKLTDVDFGSMTASLQFMTRMFGQAARGGKEAQETFRNLGLDFKLLAELPVDVQLEAVAEALSRVENESERTAFQQQVLGRGGMAMAQAMEGGAAKIREIRQEARDLGATTKTELAAAADDAKDAIDRLTGAITPLKNALINELAPVLERIATKLRETFFPTEQEEKIQAARKELESRKKLLTQANEELAVYQRLQANQNLRREDMAAFEAARRRVSVLRSEIFDAEIALEQLLATANKPGVGGGGGGGAGGGGKPNVPGVIAPTKSPVMRDTKAANEMFAQAERWAERERALLVKQETARANAMKMAAEEAALIQESIELRAQAEGAASEQLTEMLIQRMQERLAIEDELTGATEEHEQIRLRAKKDAADQSVELASQVATAEIARRQQVADASIGLLSALGSEHRGAAIAALGLQKAMTLKQIFFSGQAQARAEAAWAAIFGGPAAAAAAFARVMLQTKIQMGLVAATGLIEAAQLSHGGTTATRGTTANPMITSSVGASASGAAAAAGRKQSVVTVQFMGPIYGWDDYIRNKVIEGIREAVDGKDVVIIGPASLQAQLIGGG